MTRGSQRTHEPVTFWGCPAIQLRGCHMAPKCKGERKHPMLHLMTHFKDSFCAREKGSHCPGLCGQARFLVALLWRIRAQPSDLGVATCALDF